MKIFLSISLRLLLALLLYCPSLTAQALYNLDSLKGVLVQQTDTTQLKTSLLIADHFVFDAELLDSGKVYIDQSLQQAERLQHIQCLSSAWFLLGVYHKRRQEFEQSLEASHQALTYIRQLNQPANEASCLINIGGIYLAQAEDKKALEYYLEALAIAQKSQAKKRLSTIYNSLSIVYSRQNQNEEAIRYQKLALSIVRQIKDNFREVHILNNLASSFMDVGNLDSAAFYSQACLSVSQEKHSYAGTLLATTQLTRIYRKLGQWDKALEHADMFIKLVDTSRDAGKLSGLLRQKAWILDTLGQVGEARHIMEKSYEWAQASNDIMAQMSIHLDLANFYRKYEAYQLALPLFRRYFQMNDSLYGEEKAKEVRRLEAQFHTKQQTYELERLENESRVQQLQIRERSLWLLFIGMVAIICLGGAFLIHRHRLIKEKRRSMLAKEQAIRAQMNPQFLFHALSAIQEIIFQEKDALKAARYLAKFAKLMRLILENSRESLIPLDQEIKTLRLFLDLQQVRFLHTFSYQVESDINMDSFDLYIQPLKAQPILENMLQSHVSDQQGHSKLSIIVKETETGIDMEVELAGDLSRRKERIVYHCEAKDPQ